MPHSSDWTGDLNGQHHSGCFGQEGGNSNSEYNCKCGILEDADDCVCTASKEQRAEETESEGDEQGIVESPVVGPDNGTVLLLHKEPRTSDVIIVRLRVVPARIFPVGFS